MAPTPSTPPMIGISSPSTSKIPTTISPASTTTRLSTLWPLPSTLSPHASIALNLLAFLITVSLLATLIIYLKRHYRKKHFGFDLERTHSHHGFFRGSGAYGRFGLTGYTETDESGNYKLRSSPRQVKGLRSVGEGRGKRWEYWAGGEMERDRERERDRRRERHLERGRQLWRGRSTGEIGSGPKGKL